MKRHRFAENLAVIDYTLLTWSLPSAKCDRCIKMKTHRETLTTKIIQNYLQRIYRHKRSYSDTHIPSGQSMIKLTQG